MREYGMNVEFNGKFYRIISEAEIKQYAIGEMACEMMRFEPSKLKDVLTAAPHFSEPLDKELVVSDLFWLREQLLKQYLLVVAEMISVAFMNMAIEYLTADEENKKEWLKAYTSCDKQKEIGENILKEQPFDSFGADTIGQFLLTLYYGVSQEYCVCAAAFISLAKSGEDPKEMERAQNILDLYNDEHNFQDIDYRLGLYDGRFNSVFTIKSFISLLMFEVAHILDSETQVVKCKSCGHYFIPLKRSDTRYCNYPSPENPEKTCKEIGAQKAWANKEKTDDVTREYRKVYMRYKMTVKRHPDNQEAQQKLNRLTDGIKEWRQKLDAGEAGTADFMRWLEEL